LQKRFIHCLTFQFCEHVRFLGREISLSDAQRVAHATVMLDIGADERVSAKRHNRVGIAVRKVEAECLIASGNRRLPGSGAAEYNVAWRDAETIAHQTPRESMREPESPAS
jgi:hypothetical protein